MPLSSPSPHKQPVIYGKVRKASRSISIFRDTEPILKAPNIDQEKSLSRFRPKRKAPLSQVSFGDESIDELAGDAFLKDIPKQLGAARSLRSEIITEAVTRPSSNRSFHTAKEAPAVNSSPTRTVITSPKAQNIVRLPLANKSTNSKAKTVNKGVRAPKTVIPASVAQRRTSAETLLFPEPPPNSSLVAHDLVGEVRPSRSHFTRTISDLLREAARQEAESQRREATYKSELAKPSPRQRAKANVIKASRVVRKKLRPKVGLLKSSEGSVAKEMFSHGTERRLKGHRESLNRHITEGVNLSNPKIQSLTGDISAPRKPLPIYESMRSRMERSSMEEDPFLDVAGYMGITHSASARDDSIFADSSMQIEHPDTSNSVEKVSMMSARTSQSQASLGSKPTRGFSPEISGLAQHSDTLLFSSSPEATSTPLSKWKTGPASLRKIKKAVSNKKKTAKAKFENRDDSSIISTPVTEGGRSIKRRSGNDDLRSPSTPLTKRARLSHPSHDGSSSKLTSDINAMNTGDNNSQSPSPKFIRGKVARSPYGKKRRGLGIFDVHIGKGKGKSKESPAEENQNSRLDGSHLSRPSFSRPQSMSFGRVSKMSSRGDFAKLPDHDQMEIDELA